MLCGFEAEFLAVPQEALIATMEANQKFFPVLDAQGKLTEHFIGIANIESKDVAEVRKGYERVIRPRFADAKFFFDEDMKQGLSSMGDGLATVTYQAKLGTVADKVARVPQLAEDHRARVGPGPGARAPRRRAVEGRPAIAPGQRIPGTAGHRRPLLRRRRGRADRSRERDRRGPTCRVSPATRSRPRRWARCWRSPSAWTRWPAVSPPGLKPTGNKDPFALRRNALGLARTMIEAWHRPAICRALHRSARATQTRCASARTDDERRARTTSSSTACAATTPTRACRRSSSTPSPRCVRCRCSTSTAACKAIGEFAALPEAEALAAANKRIRNILKKAEGDVAAAVDAARFTDGAERDLGEAVEAAIGDTDASLKARDYVAVLGRLARLRPQVDAFFDEVMVNVDDAAVRNNRLALLKRLADRLGSVAAIEHLST